MQIGGALHIKPLCCSSQTDSSGIANIFFKIPEGGRFLRKGTAWFDDYELGDRVYFEIVDVDNTLGQGAGFVVYKYYEEDQNSPGHFVPPTEQVVIAESIDGSIFVEAGLYIKVVGVKASEVLGKDFRANIVWGAVS